MAAVNPIVFLANGDAIPAAGATAPKLRGGKPAATKTRGVRLTATARGAATQQRLEAVPGEDLVLLTIGNGQGPDLQLRLHPEHARDLLRAQAGNLVRGQGVVALEPDAIAVPFNAQWPGASGASRGGLDLVFKALELVGIDVQKLAAERSADALAKVLDGQVTEDVYPLQLAELSRLKQAAPADIAASSEPTLVFIHGTFVDTTSSFGKLWSLHHSLVRQLFAHYGDRVYALDHGTVKPSPIANALTLARRLPQGARLHLVTHSRGGLVAEVLLRASQGVTEADLAQFPGEPYAQHREDLRALGQMLTDKRVQVERIVRVACPAYGTLLASNRLDAYLSALAWLLERAGLPPLGALVDFANAVARERTDPTSLPGIEAMRRSSALIGWLNSPLPAPVANGLRVVAGDIAGDSLVSWVKTLLADSYYWTDNDLVVQTSSMYGGVPRGDDALFLLDRSGKTDHFSYFANDGTANGVAQALLQAQPDGFAPIGPLSREGKSATGARGAQRDAVPVPVPDGSRPAVVLLPGILGSNLRRGDQREWLVWWRLPGLINRIALDQPGIAEDGPIGRYYDALMAHLHSSHDVLPFGYDWRLNLADSAKLLAAQVSAALAQREASRQPVRLLAHSMGSLVLRVMRLNHPDVWQAMMERKGARVLLLGPPNAGSWAPMTIYTGDDSFGQFLSTVGGAFQDEAARQKMVAFPGLVQMQAGLTDTDLRLGDASHWQDMADRDFQAAQQSHSWHNATEQVAAYRWAVPSQANLDTAAALRRSLDAQAANLGSDAAKMAIVLGQAPATPCGLRWGDAGMQYLSTPEGDGRVTWDAACLPGVATWQTNYAHGDLPNIPANFDAYTELLVDGRTTALGAYTPATRGGARAVPRPLAALARLRDAGVAGTGLPVGEDALMAAALGGREALVLSGRNPAGSGGAPLTVEIVHGDLRFIREPLLLGHFRSLELTGTEWVLNGLLGNALQEALDLRLYPVKPGQHQIFANLHIDPDMAYPFPRPEAAIVVGLGDEGELQPNTLTDAVRQATLAFQRYTAAARGRVEVVEGVSLASTSLGSGGNLTVSQSVTAMVRGVLDANARLAAYPKPVAWPPITRLLVVELYHNRVLEAWQALRAACDAGTIAIQLLPQVRSMAGARSEPSGGAYRGAAYDLVRVSLRQCEPGASQAELEFSVYTKRARSEVRGKGTQRVLVDAIVAAAETDTVYDADLARSLFQLLVPQEIKAYLGTANTLMFEVDAGTAAYPWELLEDGDADQPEQPSTRLPWALRLSGTLLRKMRVEQFRREPTDATTHDVLVVGAPHLEPALGLPDLPGAMAEAEAVAGLFGSDATLLLDQDFLSIVKPALARTWKIIHLAGHGQYDRQGERSGMLMSGGCLFSPTEFESMSSVPELVFVNCCHLGKTENSPRRNHALFAANVAEQLIRNGVRCVVAAGWAVDDGAALAFSTAFYTALTAECTFADAVSQARRAAHKSSAGSNTWAAYQCYGDPAWTLRRSEANAQPTLRRSVTPLLPTENELLVALEAVRLDAQTANDADRKTLDERLQQLQSAAQPAWKAHGRVAEALGLAWRDVGNKSKALKWLESAVQAADGSATLLAREQQLNLKARQAATVAELVEVVALIQALVALAATPERYSILGSAYKRLVMHKDAQDQLAANLGQMQQAYAEAERLKSANLFYPLMQRCMAQLRLHWLAPDSAVPVPTGADFAAARRSLARLDAQAPDFWTVVGQQELSLLEGVAEGRLAARIDGIVAGLHDLQLRVRNQHFWSSVGDTAQFLLPSYMAAVTTQPEQDAARRYMELVASFG